MVSEHAPTVDKLAQVAAEIESLKRESDLSKEVSQLRLEVHRWRWTAGILSILAVGLGSLASVVGYKSFDGVVRGLVDQRLDYYSDLSAGFAYLDKHPRIAIPHLKRCFERQPYDEAVLISLLMALDSTNDWVEAGRIIAQIRKDPYKFESFKNAITYNNIAMSEINLGLRDPAMLDRANRTLDLGLRIATPADTEALKYLSINLWRYFLAKRDTASAQQCIDRMLRLPNVAFQPWEEVRTWRWSVLMFAADPELEAKAARMWKQLQARNVRAALAP